MNPLEIALIVIGIIVIIISCLLVDKSQKATALTSVHATSFNESLSEEDRIELKRKIEKLLEEVSEEVIIRADDTLSKISNEKIIAVNEFSDQILEKINRNHEEVVFLYNMLNDKEKELKSAVKEVDSTKKKVQDIFESKAKTENTLQTNKEIKTPQPVKNVTQAAKMEKTQKSEQNMPDHAQEAMPSGSFGSNSNTQILALYAQGKSVIEISKLLDIGQGEVKLVIDLFKGKK